jgi:hypothetical protein
MSPPPLYFLIGTDEDENLINCHIRVIKKQYIKELLNGCGFLTAGLNAIIHTSLSQNEVVESQDVYGDEHDYKVRTYVYIYVYVFIHIHIYIYIYVYI